MLRMTVRGPRRGVAARILKQFEAAEVAALIKVVPIARAVLLVTIGTQYFSLVDLHRMGSPYSKAHPNPPMPPGVINMQSGRFAGSVNMTHPIKIGKRVVLSVYATDEERVGQLSGQGGTMMARPYKLLLQARMRRQVDRALGEALQGLVKVMVKG